MTAPPNAVAADAPFLHRSTDDVLRWPAMPSTKLSSQLSAPSATLGSESAAVARWKVQMLKFMPAFLLALPFFGLSSQPLLASDDAPTKTPPPYVAAKKPVPRPEPRSRRSIDPNWGHPSSSDGGGSWHPGLSMEPF